MKFHLAKSKFVIHHDFVLELIYDENARQNDNILLQFDETLPKLVHYVTEGEENSLGYWPRKRRRVHYYFRASRLAMARMFIINYIIGFRTK